MCADPNLDPDKKGLYAKIIGEKIAAREAFTAYNITQAVRQAGNAVEHYKYKEVVHDVFAAGDMTDYLRSGIQFGQGPAFLYHPPEVDPAAWAASGGKLTGQVQPAASLPAPVSSDDDDDDDDEENDNEPDDEAEEEVANVSRAATPASVTPFKSATGFPPPKPTIRKAGSVLYVPAPMGRHIGLQPGGEAYRSMSKGEIRIGKTPGAGVAATGGVKIHVDPRGNVRIANEELKSAGIGKMVRIAIDKDTILIAKAQA